ncbi:cellulose biosynthesis protein BcsG [Pistricoccus aurantiacus]|uniref:cellulose biosynthesis protein BcsG n=1 Tax=Pistricoccus aurantiacus TaxID=1883414 RepID=UPI003626373C
MNDAQGMTQAPPFTLGRHWRGLGAWNLYFVCKLALYWRGIIDFDALANLTFAAFLLLPLPPLWLHRLRHVLAIPIGVALLYQDSWLPPFSRLLAQSSQVSAFSLDYLLELAGRIIDWHWVAVFFVLAVGYAFVAAWIRVTVPVMLALVWIAMLPLMSTIGLTPFLPTAPATATTAPGEAATGEATTETAQSGGAAPTAPTEFNDAELEARLEAFYAEESERQTVFSGAPQSPFDVLIVNVCSLSWDDMAEVGVTDHPLFDYLDIVFDDFNSATSYSGPASLRLLRASCGQVPHQALYTETPQQCHLFENLEEQGFTTTLALNHDGVFDDYLKLIREQGGIEAPAMSREAFEPIMTAFDDSPVYRDRDMLNAWAEQPTEGQPSATFYNTVTLHDGNRIVGEKSFAEYEPLLRQLFDDLLAFLQRLESEGRQVAVLVVPEHGAALSGDKMQFAGMREIPTPAITHVPVGVKLTGLEQPRQDDPIHIEAPSSYLAVSELLSRLLQRDVFAQQDVDWETLTADLPETKPVSTNEGVAVMPADGSPYIRLQGDGWMPYPGG